MDYLYVHMKDKLVLHETNSRFRTVGKGWACRAKCNTNSSHFESQQRELLGALEEYITKGYALIEDEHMANSKVETRITLTLNKEEAEYLLAILQNPYGCTPLEELELDKECRSAIWSELNKCLR